RPKRAGDEWIYPLTPDQLAARVPDLVDAGVTLLGGCCGTTPAHIAAMREAVDKLGVLWQPGAMIRGQFASEQCKMAWGLHLWLLQLRLYLIRARRYKPCGW